MNVTRFAVSFDQVLARDIRRSAGKEPTSAWLADAARRKLRSEGLLRVIGEWEDKHGELPSHELKTAEGTTVPAAEVKGTVLDSGALIALERNDRSLWGVLKYAALSSVDVVVPSTALAQVWRRSPTQALLSRALQYCVIAPFDGVAREVGELCGRTRTADICDAHVAIVAANQGAILYTSDPNDLRTLVSAIGRERPVIIRC